MAKNNEIRYDKQGNIIGNRIRIFSKTGGKCHICLKKLELNRFSVDHLLPLSKGGRNVLDNKMPAHTECNLVKGDKVIGVDVTLEQLREIIHKRRMRKKYGKLKYQFHCEKHEGLINKKEKFNVWLKNRKNAANNK